jgi:hypothetical protein
MSTESSHTESDEGQQQLAETNAEKKGSPKPEKEEDVSSETTDNEEKIVVSKKPQAKESACDSKQESSKVVAKVSAKQSGSGSSNDDTESAPGYLELTLGQVIKKALTELVDEESIKSFMKEKDISKGKLLHQIMNAPAPAPPPKVKAAGAIPNPDELKALKSKNFKHGLIADGKHCIYFYGATGKRKFECCAVKSGNIICPAHKNNPACVKLSGRASREGFDYDVYIKEATTKRLNWVANKEKALAKQSNGKISIAAPAKKSKARSSGSTSEEEDSNGSDESVSDEAVSDKKTVEYKHDKKYKYLEKHGAVIEGEGDDATIIGLDIKNVGGTLKKLDKAAAAKFNEMDYTVSPDALDKEARASWDLKQKQKENAKKAAPVVTQRRTITQARKPGQKK